MSSNRKLGLFLTLGLMVASASLSAPASAQFGGGSYGRGPYGNGNYGNGNYGNGNYGNGNNANGNYGNGNYGGGYYGGRGARAQQFFDRFQSDAHQFRKSLDNVADNRSYSNDSRGDNIKQLGRDFDDAVNQLRRNFKNSNNVNSDVQNVLNYGARLNNLMQRSRFSSNVQQNWATVASDLNLLSQVSYRGRSF